MFPITVGSIGSSCHRIGDNFIYTNGYSVTDSLIKRMKNKESGVRNMAVWWIKAFALNSTTLTAKMPLAQS